MDLSELRERVTAEEETRQGLAAQGVLTGEVVEDEEEEYDEDDELIFYNEEDVFRAVSLLKQSMQTLGFFGDRELAGPILKNDRARMTNIAEKIRKFLISIQNSPNEE